MARSLPHRAGFNATACASASASSPCCASAPGAGELELELPEGARCATRSRRSATCAAGLPVVMAVNREYADEAAPLSRRRRAGADPAGQRRARRRRTRGWPTSRCRLDALVARVRDPRAGAVVTFRGVTRDVEQLDYEAYAEMAEPVMREIVAAASSATALCAAAAEHRIGPVALGEPSVVVAASAPHRGEAFAGAREIIDESRRGRRSGSRRRASGSRDRPGA